MQNSTTQKNKTSILSICCASIATIIEWYDFTAYIFVSAIIAKLFFPSDNHFLSLMETFIVFASGYLMRPLGGLFFGNLGDKIGRKKVIVIVLILMALSVLTMALMPTFSQTFEHHRQSNLTCFNNYYKPKCSNIISILPKIVRFTRNINAL